MQNCFFRLLLMTCLGSARWHDEYLENHPHGQCQRFATTGLHVDNFVISN